MSQRSFRRARARRIERERRRVANVKRRAMVAGATAGATLIFAASAQAAAYTVNTTADSTDTGGCTTAQVCSLRDAITAANASPGASGDTITFANTVTGTIDLGTALSLSDTNGLTIKGPGAGALAVSGVKKAQVFRVSAPATISGLTIEDGYISDGDGGAIEATATLSLSDDTIKDSMSTSYGGGVFNSKATTIADSTITGNTALSGGGV